VRVELSNVLASGFVDIFFATAAENPAEITSALGTPAIDASPFRLWAQLARQCMSSITAARLDYGSLA
jgi:hypothetical protein